MVMVYDVALREKITSISFEEERYVSYYMCNTGRNLIAFCTCMCACMGIGYTCMYIVSMILQYYSNSYHVK